MSDRSIVVYTVIYNTHTSSDSDKFLFSRCNELLSEIEDRVEFINERSRYLMLSAQEMQLQDIGEENRTEAQRAATAELIATHTGPDGENFVVTSMSACVHPNTQWSWGFGLDLCPESWCKSGLACPLDRAVYDSGGQKINIYKIVLIKIV